MGKRVKLLEKILMIACITLILINIPSIYVKAEEQELKTIIGNDNAIEKIYKILTNGKIIGKKNGKIYFLNSELFIISDAYEKISENGYGLEVLFAKKNGKFGVIDYNETIIIPFKYDEIYNQGPSLYRVRLGDNYGIINLKGEVMVPIIYKYFKSEWGWGEFYRIQKDGIISIIDSNNKLILSAKEKYDNSFEINSNHTMKVQNGEYYGVIDSKGKEIIPIEYQSISTSQTGISIVKKDNKYGLIDQEGKIIIPLKYEQINTFQDYGYKVKIGDKYGLVDQNDKEILPIVYDSFFIAGPYYYGVVKDNKYGIIDHNGNIMIPFEYDHIESEESQDFYIATKNHKVGVIDISGKEMIPFEYNELSYSSDKFSGYKDQKRGSIDIKGNVIIPFIYDFIAWGGIAKKNGKFGMLDNKNNIIIPFEYDENAISDTIFHCGLYRVKKDGKYGALDTKGNIIIPFIYDSIYELESNTSADENKFLTVTKGGKTAIIDKNNKIILDYTYNKIIYISNASTLEHGKVLTSKTCLVFDSSFAEKNLVTIKTGCILYKNSNIAEGNYAKLKAGTKVEWISDTDTGWSKVLLGSKLGFVKNTCLNKKNLSYYQKTLVTTTVAFRSQREVDKKTTISIIPEGTYVTVISKMGNWIQIKHKGKDGYIVTSKTEVK